MKPWAIRAFKSVYFLPLLMVCFTLVDFRGSHAQNQTQPLTPEEFESLTEGRTLEFQQNGTPFGKERYLPGRRVIWAIIPPDATEGQPLECLYGRWHPEGDQICFQYDDPITNAPGEAVCWDLMRSKDGSIIAQSTRTPEMAPLISNQEQPSSLICKGPSVGA